MKTIKYNNLKDTVKSGIIMALLMIMAIPVYSFDHGAAINGQEKDSTQEMSLNLDRVEKNYLHALQSSNEGVVESTIYNILMLKLKFPNREIGEIKDELKQLAMEGNEQSVRYKAYIAMNFIGEVQWLSQYKEVAFLLESSDQEQLFRILADELKKGYLTSAGQ